MERPTRADRGLRPDDEGQRSGGEEGRKEVEVRFFGPDSFKGLPRKPLEACSLLIHRVLLGKGPYHCHVVYEGMVYDCNLTHGCAIYREPYGELVPTAQVTLLAELDLSWFMESRRFQLVLSLFDLLGFVPAVVRPINCVQATAQAVGVETRCRTPRDLLEVLRLCPTHSHHQRSPSSQTRVRKKPRRVARSGGRRSVDRGKPSRRGRARSARSNYKRRHSAASKWQHLSQRLSMKASLGTAKSGWISPRIRRA